MDLFKINVQIRKCEVDSSFFLFLQDDEDAIWHQCVLFYAVIDELIIHSIKLNIFAPDASPHPCV